MVARQALNLKIGVRSPAPQLIRKSHQVYEVWIFNHPERM